MFNYFIACLNKYATFSGRARRKEYWSFYFFVLLFSIVAGALDGLLGIPALALIVTFGSIIPNIAVAVRRAHDSNHSGWFILIPIYNIILLFLPGTEGPNKYGPDPKTESGFASNSEVLDDHLL